MSQFYVHIGLIVVRYILRVVHSGDENVSPSSLVLGGILESYYTQGGIRGKQGFNGEELDISHGCHQVYPWCIPTPLSVVVPGGTCMLPALVRDRLSPTKKEKLWCKVCLHPHLE